MELSKAFSWPGLFKTMKHRCKILAVIPARGGSKGIPGKNIKRLGGLPLIAWTIREAKKSKYIDRLIVSTEDKKIAAVAKKYGAEVPFLRPKALSRDHVPGLMPILHALRRIQGYTGVLCLQATSPFRKSSDIDNLIRLAKKRNALSVASVSPAEKHPAWSFYFTRNQRLVPFLPKGNRVVSRQKLPEAWALNGAMFYAQTAWLKRRRSLVTAQTLGFPMPSERSLDLDTPQEWFVASLIAKKLKKVALSRIH